MRRGVATLLVVALGLLTLFVLRSVRSRPVVPHPPSRTAPKAAATAAGEAGAGALETNRQATPAVPDSIKTAVAVADAQQAAVHRAAQLPEVLRGLSTPDSSAQFASLMRLREYKLPASEMLSAIAPLLDAEDELVKHGALQAIAFYGADAAYLAPGVVAILLDPSGGGELRVQAARTLQSIGIPSAEAIPQMTAILQVQTTSPSVRRAILQLLGGLGLEARSSLPVIVQTLHESANTATQLEAFRAIGRIEDAANRSELLAKPMSLTEFSPAEAFAVLEGLKRGADASPWMSELVRVATEQPDGYLRAAAVEVLGLMAVGTREGASALLTALARGDYTVAQLAEDALLRVPFGSAAAVEPLAEGLEHGLDRVRRTSALALAHIGPVAAPAAGALGRALDVASGDTAVLEVGAYLEALRRIGPGARHAVPSILRGLRSEARLYEGRYLMHSMHIRSYLYVTLSDVGVPPEALSVIEDGLRSHHPTVFAGAARAAAALGARAYTLAPQLVAALEAGDIASMVDFTQFGGMFSFDTSAQTEALRALTRMGPSAAGAVPQLKKFLASPDQFPWLDRDEVTNALRSINAN